MCYLVRINDFDDGSVFHIVKKNLKINTAPVQPFTSKKCVQAPAAMPGDAVNPDRLSTHNVTTTIEGGLSRAATREEIDDFDDGSVFHIVKKNLKINTAPAQPFTSKECIQAPAATCLVTRSTPIVRPFIMSPQILKVACRALQRGRRLSISASKASLLTTTMSRCQRMRRRLCQEKHLLPAHERSPSIVAAAQTRTSPIKPASLSFTDGTRLQTWTSSNCSTCASPRSGLSIWSSHRPTRLWASPWTSKSFTLGWGASSSCRASLA